MERMRQFNCHQIPPEYLHLLYAIVRGLGAEKRLKRNQALVMRHMMRSFLHVAADFSLDRQLRYTVGLMLRTLHFSLLFHLHHATM